MTDVRENAQGVGLVEEHKDKHSHEDSYSKCEKYRLRVYGGVAKSVEKGSESHVASHASLTGSKYIDTTIHRNMTIWLLKDNGVEEDIGFDSHNVKVGPGHRVSIVQAVSEESGHYTDVALVNHTTKKFYVHKNAGLASFFQKYLLKNNDVTMQNLLLAAIAIGGGSIPYYFTDWNGFFSEEMFLSSICAIISVGIFSIPLLKFLNMLSGVDSRHESFMDHIQNHCRRIV